MVRLQILIFLLSLTNVHSYKLVVLGDLHGDYDTLVAVLKENRVLDENNKWLEKTTKVISVGDTIGRGHQDQMILTFIKNMTDNHNWLQQLGNHEIMQLRNDWRYARDGENIGFGSLKLRKKALKQGSELGSWLRGLPAIQLEADNLFIHAGLYDSRNIGRSLEDINQEISYFLRENKPR